MSEESKQKAEADIKKDMEAFPRPIFAGVIPLSNGILRCAGSACLLRMTRRAAEKKSADTCRRAIYSLFASAIYSSNAIFQPSAEAR